MDSNENTQDVLVVLVSRPRSFAELFRNRLCTELMPATGSGGGEALVLHAYTEGHVSFSYRSYSTLIPPSFPPVHTKVHFRLWFVPLHSPTYPGTLIPQGKHMWTMHTLFDNSTDDQIFPSRHEQSGKGEAHLFACVSRGEVL